MKTPEIPPHLLDVEKETEKIEAERVELERRKIQKYGLQGPSKYGAGGRRGFKAIGKKKAEKKLAGKPPKKKK